MEAKNKKAIIFDLDGTLWDSAIELLGAWNEIFRRNEDAKVQLTLEELQAQLGKPMDKIATSVMPHLSYERAVEIIDQCGEYENEYLRKHGAVIFDGLERTLKVLSETYDLYVVSNCQSGYIEAFLEYYDFWQYFKGLECYGNTLKGKADNIRILMENHQIKQAVYVGDTQGDYDSCQQAGIPFIWASYGFGQVDTDVPVLKDIRDLPQLLNTIEVWR